MADLQQNIQEQLSDLDSELDLVALERPGTDSLRIFIDHLIDSAETCFTPPTAAANANTPRRGLMNDPASGVTTLPRRS